MPSLEKYSAQGAEQARQAGSQIFNLANSLKAFEGEPKGLRDNSIMDKKRQEEADFKAKVMANPEWKAAYGSAWDAIAEAEKKMAARAKERALSLARFAAALSG